MSYQTIPKNYPKTKEPTETSNAKTLTNVMLVPTIVTIGLIGLTLMDDLIAVARPEHLVMTLQQLCG